jgi:hypothetical protein
MRRHLCAGVIQLLWIAWRLAEPASELHPVPKLAPSSMVVCPVARTENGKTQRLDGSKEEEEEHIGFIFAYRMYLQAGSAGAMKLH